MVVLITLTFLFGPNSFGKVVDSELGFFADSHEISVYQDRGSWALEGVFPYKANFAEYPELAVWLFGGINYIFGENNFQLAWLFLMAVFTYLFFIVLIKFLEFLKKSYLWVYLFFLPSLAYFAFNRFDIIPALFVMLAIYLLITKNLKLAFFVLALAFLFKWYALVLIPLFWLVIYREEKRISRLVLPSIFFAVPIIVVFSTTIIGAGLDSFLSVYEFHLARSCELGNLWGTANYYFFNSSFQQENWFCSQVTLLLQFLIPLGICGYLFFKKKDKFTAIQIISLAIILISIFVFFNRLYSNQWVLWFLPLFIILATDKLDIVLIAIFEVVNWLLFPFLPRYLPASLAAGELTAIHVYNLFSVVLMILFVLIIFRAYEKYHRHSNI